MLFPDPVDMTAPEQLMEIAALLARGYLRSRQLALAPGPIPFTEKPLDVPGQPRPPLSDGLTARELEVSA